MAKPEKIQAVSQYKQKLEDKSNFILTAFSGLTVKDLTDIRLQLRGINSEFKVVKNNLFLIALKQSEKHKNTEIDFGKNYFGPMAAVFANEELPAAAKILKDFAKDKESLQMKSGFMDGQTLSGKDVESIAGLPSKQELLSQIAGGLNAQARSIASGINQIMAGLARAINAVAEKNNR